MDLDKKTEQK